jgi:hypothetical protein
LVTDISRQPTGLIFKGQAVTPQKSKDRNYIAPEAQVFEIYNSKHCAVFILSALQQAIDIRSKLLSKPM